uniref:Uncharacterized protein n=1 Tax=Myoviridae sp. ctIty1 TaxID=2827673 RepID=A0A8S5TG25_9CAUD|nr:MAG TPA: hypothetical protein [Myoviridae sp. ctIty1]
MGGLYVLFTIIYCIQNALYQRMVQTMKQKQRIHLNKV